MPSEAVKIIALKNGITPEKLSMKGLPIRPSFWKEAESKNTVRKELGLAQSTKTVLLMGGGDGVGGLGKIAKSVAKNLEKLDIPSQMVVICGHNNKMAKNLQKSLKETKKLKVHIKGFVQNIDEFMSASDCLVTKAGPGTIAESMIRGLPLILSSYLPGQEYGNVPYVVGGGFGMYTGNRPRKIAKAVNGLFINDDKRLEMSQKVPHINTSLFFNDVHY